MEFELKTNCQQCNSHFSTTIGYLDNPEFAILKCENGHKTEAFITVPRFSLYFDKGIKALCDEYYYEAYSWIYTSLEVFRKDFVKTYLNIFNKLDIKTIDDTFDTRFKFSENIYGAYAFSYLSYFEFPPDLKNSPYPLIQSKEIKRRNDLFHNGKLMTPEEIKDDCYQIFKHMLFAYQNFTDTKKDDGGSAISLYYGNRYCAWAEENHYSDDDILSRKIILFNSDLGAFDSNSSYKINEDGTGDFLTLEEMMKRSKENSSY